MTMPFKVASHTAVAAIAIASACARADLQSPNAVTVVDSGGTVIVRNYAPEWTESSKWTLDTVPIASVGGNENDPQQQFKIIDVATRLSDGRIGIATEGELRWFDASGKYLMTSMPRGDGPGEFRSIRKLYKLSGDTIVAEGSGGASKTVTFAPNGAFVRENRLDCERFKTIPGSINCAGELLPDGSFLTVDDDPTIPYNETHRKTIHLPDDVTTLGTGHVRQLYRRYITPPTMDGAYPAGIWGNIEYFQVPNGRQGTTTIIHPFYSRRSYLAAGGTPLRIVMAANPAYEIEIWTPQGKLERLVRRIPGLRVPNETEKKDAIASIAKQMEQRESPLTLGHVLSAIEAPDSLPAVVGLFVGASGEFFVQREGFLRSQKSHLFDVFNHEGRWLGELRLPPRAKLVEVGNDYLLAVRLHEFDVPHVEVYRLRR